MPAMSQIDSVLPLRSAAPIIHPPVRKTSSSSSHQTPLSTPTSGRPSLSIIPSDFDDLSPLDALAAQGRLLNKRLTQHGAKESISSFSDADSLLDQSVFPKFGLVESLDDRGYRGFERRNRLPERRKTGDSDKSDSPRSPVDNLSLATLSLLTVPRPLSPNLQRSTSQTSSVLSISTSSDESMTPIDHHVAATRIYQALPKHETPRLRPIVKADQLEQSHDASESPASITWENALTDIRTTAPLRPFAAQSNTLDRPRLPSIQLAHNYDDHRTPSINFSRPYSSKSTSSDVSSAYEVDYFSQQNTPPTEDRLHVPYPSSGTESAASSPGLNQEEINRLPRGRSASRSHVIDTGVFFHSTSMNKLDTAHRWPQTPITPTTSSERRFPSSPPQLPTHPTESLGPSLYSKSEAASTSSLPLPSTRPDTSSTISTNVHSSTHPQARQTMAFKSTHLSTTTTPLLPPQPIFSSPTQVLPSSSRSTLSISVPKSSLSAEDHLTLGIQFHEQDQLAQSTHHFMLSAQGGSPTGMLFYSLSLRHGWGCAANPEKAVEWLHYAADAASGEQVDEKHAATFSGKAGKKGGATLALAIYELGQSYMHGWGVAKDKRLALRCYEISAKCGDPDGQWYEFP